MKKLSVLLATAVASGSTFAADHSTAINTAVTEGQANYNEKIKETDPEDVKLDITNIHVRCGGSESTAPDIHLVYNH